MILAFTEMDLQQLYLGFEPIIGMSGDRADKHSGKGQETAGGG